MLESFSVIGLFGMGIAGLITIQIIAALGAKARRYRKARR